jgi:hypothetical protein
MESQHKDLKTVLVSAIDGGSNSAKPGSSRSGKWKTREPRRTAHGAIERMDALGEIIPAL